MTKDLKYYLNSAIAICIMIFFRFIPAPEPITTLGMTVIGIFLGAIYAWCTVDLIWPSMIALIMYGFTGYTTPSAAWNTLISNPTVGICLWLMIVVGLLTTSNLTGWIAQWSVSRPWTKGRPWVLFHVVIIATMMCASIVGGIATIVLFMTLAVSICEEVGYKKGDSMAAFFLFAVGMYATIGNMYFPFHTAILANFGLMAAGSNGAYDGTFSYTSYMIFSFITITAAYIFSFLFFRYVLRPDVSLLKNYDPGKKVLPKMTKQQKLSIILVAILFIMLLGPSIFPQGSFLQTITNKLSTVGSSILIIAVACFIKVDGKPFTTLPKLINENVMWQVVFMFGTALLLAQCLNSPDSGVSLWLKDLIGPLFSHFGPIGFLVGFMFMAMFITNLINNAVVSAIMLPISYSFCIELGLNPVAFVACFVLFVDYAFLLPSSSPCGALMHSSDGWLPKKFLYIYGTCGLLIIFIVSLAIGWPIGCMVF